MTIKFHEINHQPKPNNLLLIPSIQCHFSVEQAIDAPIEVVWSLVRQFHNPKSYKLFIKSSFSQSHLNTIGSCRNITHVTGFPATTSVERLDKLDDEIHVMVFSLVGGDHSYRLANYQSTISLFEDVKNDCVFLGGQRRTFVTEKYSVDVPKDSNKEDTRLFVDTLVGLNLKSLARIAEDMVD